MKRSTRLIIAIVLTLILTVVSINVWAGPGRKGTVPIPPRNYHGQCGNVINFGLGTVTASGAECILNVKLIDKPVKLFAEPLPDWSYLFPYVVNVTLVKGDITSLEICVPFIPEWENMTVNETISWYRWDESQGTWIAVPTAIQDGPPKMICGTSDQVGVFSLQGQ